MARPLASHTVEIRRMYRLGHSAQDIADHMDMTVGAVRAAIRRAEETPPPKPRKPRKVAPPPVPVPPAPPAPLAPPPAPVPPAPPTRPSLWARIVAVFRG
jgi:hypothetical protein